MESLARVDILMTSCMLCPFKETITLCFVCAQIEPSFDIPPKILCFQLLLAQQHRTECGYNVESANLCTNSSQLFPALETNKQTQEGISLKRAGACKHQSSFKLTRIITHRAIWRAYKKASTLTESTKHIPSYNTAKIDMYSLWQTGFMKSTCYSTTWSIAYQFRNHILTCFNDFV